LQFISVSFQQHPASGCLGLTADPNNSLKHKWLAAEHGETDPSWVSGGKARPTHKVKAITNTRHSPKHRVKPDKIPQL